ncbi:UDP-3-O-(3-hydroxymyristoyl)glucosamine N-acyltransferase [bacterium]|nr:UDP-3-O-(3-hydroxymyristoyl)glucosamine N-acyltransferase [bacterium]MBU1025290.1 UDP-3-O-(3-hydroxymyristoyl)glucosamine N-acyltransferase [bacterium]
MKEVTLKEISETIKAEMYGDGSLAVSQISSLEKPIEGTVLFIDNISLLDSIDILDKVGIIVHEKPENISGNFMVHPHPRAAFALVAARFNPPYWQTYEGQSSRAIIEDNTTISNSAVICAGSFIGNGASIGNNTYILPNVHIGRGVTIGNDCVIHPGVAVLDGSRLANRVIINSNAVIGGEGFGFIPSENDLVKMPQMGGVIIENDVEIGSGTCIDRGTIGDTVIGEGTKIDNLVQIAHNVQIGKNARIAAQVGVPGRVRIEDDVVIGGQAGLQNGITIGKGARIAGQSGVFKSVNPGETVSGYPALPHKEALKLSALFKKLPMFVNRITELEKKIEKNAC